MKWTRHALHSCTVARRNTSWLLRWALHGGDVSTLRPKRDQIYAPSETKFTPEASQKLRPKRNPARQLPGDASQAVLAQGLWVWVWGTSCLHSHRCPAIWWESHVIWGTYLCGSWWESSELRSSAFEAEGCQPQPTALPSLLSKWMFISPVERFWCTCHTEGVTLRSGFW